MNLKTGHTEDALLFSFTFCKYSDGTVYLESTDLLPCWVDLRTEPSAEYPIIPLDASLKEQWQSLYGLTDEALLNAQKSYERTTALTGPGMLTAQNYLSQQLQQPYVHIHHSLLLQPLRVWYLLLHPPQVYIYHASTLILRCFLH